MTKMVKSVMTKLKCNDKNFVMTKIKKCNDKFEKTENVMTKMG